jgi:Tfp pilus assembly protein PilF
MNRLSNPPQAAKAFPRSFFGAFSMVVAVFATSVATSFAADTGSTTAEPTAAERLTNGRKWIAENNWRNAITELRAAVRSDPASADAHNLLAYSYRKQAKPDLDKAFEHYRAALKLDPKHKGAHEYIGEAYLMANKPQEALSHLTQLEQICGNKTCEEYVDLAAAIAAHKTGKPVPNQPASANRW